jgi:myo-inositol-1(or 4)-monophosphatase
MRIDLPKLLDIVQEAASRAKQAFDKGSFAVHEKAKGDWASTADAEVEAFLKQALHELCPQACFLGEEGGLSEAFPASRASGQTHEASSFTWVVDPIDGTANFVRGIPHFCSVVALVDAQQEPLIGLIVDPCRHESFWAETGQGAWCNGRPLVPLIDRPAIESLLAVVTPKPKSPVAKELQLWLPKAVQSFGGVRRSGAMALDLAWIAAGRMDAFAGFNLDPWDVMAGSLLVRETGGHYEDHSIVASEDGSRSIRRIAAASGRQCLDTLCSLDSLLGKAPNN